MVLVATLTPVGEVLVVKTRGVGAEVFKDGIVLAAFVEEIVDSLADGFGQASDFAGALARASAAGLKGGDDGLCERAHWHFRFLILCSKFLKA